MSMSKLLQEFDSYSKEQQNKIIAEFKRPRVLNKSKPATTKQLEKLLKLKA